MNSLIQEFDDKTTEVNKYFSFLSTLHEPDVSFYVLDSNGVVKKNLPIDGEMIPILKANAFLLLYNLIEFALREGILKIYNEIRRNNYNYSQIRSEIGAIWKRHQFMNCLDPNSNLYTYHAKACELIDHILESKAIILDRNAIPLSGNVDANKVREICDLHGISKRTPSSANGGTCLEEIKKQRNLLAHGSLAFSDCGRNFRIDQLIDFKNEAITFIRSILLNIKDYFDQESFLRT